MALVDALGNLVRFLLLPGQAHDMKGVEPLIKGVSFTALLADKAFDANWLLEELDDGGTTAVNPHKSRRHSKYLSFGPLLAAPADRHSVSSKRGNRDRRAERVYGIGSPRRSGPHRPTLTPGLASDRPGWRLIGAIGGGIDRTAVGTFGASRKFRILAVNDD